MASASCLRLARWKPSSCSSCMDGETRPIMPCDKVKVESSHPRLSRRGSFGSAERIEHIVHKTYKDAVLLADQGTLPSPLLSPSARSSSSHDDHPARAKPNENGSSSNPGAEEQGPRSSASAAGESRGLLIVVSLHAHSGLFATDCRSLPYACIYRALIR